MGLSPGTLIPPMPMDALRAEMLTSIESLKIHFVAEIGKPLSYSTPDWPVIRRVDLLQDFTPTAGSKDVQGVALLGSNAKLRFAQRPDGLHVQLPGRPQANYACVLRVTFGGGSHQGSSRFD